MVNRELPGALPARQRRSQKSARRIADAVDALLREKSFDQLTIAEIASKAGLTPGAIYRRFENKQALLPAVFDRYRAILGAWRERVNPEYVFAETASLDEAIARVVRETHKTFKDYAHLFRTVHLYGRLHPDMSQTPPSGVDGADFAPLEPILRHYRNDLHGDPAVLAKMIGHVLISSIIERTLYPTNLPAAALRCSDRRFVKDLAEMLSGWAARH